MREMEAPSYTYYLGLGTNLGDKEQNLHDAVCHTEKRIGSILALSAFIETAPWGFASGNSFLNAAVCVKSAFPPFQVLALTQAIEHEMGRTHKSTGGIYADRIIDIDLLLCNNLIIDTPQLTIPHPLMHLRRFVMQPLAEIAPDTPHPVLGKTMRQLLETCPA